MDAQESQIFITLLIALLVIGCIIAYFIISVLNHHKQVLSIRKTNSLAEVAALEKDRARIAADLHDELSPVLSAVKLKISSFELHDAADRLQQQKTNEHLNGLLKRMREISFDLMPVTLQRKGLSAALQELADYWSNRHQLEILLEAEDVPLGDNFRINLYRIVQEVIHNTIKHAQATQLKIVLKRQKTKLFLTAVDNGRGFNYQKAMKEESGLGLRNLLSRTDALGGEMFLETALGEGTRYTIEIPLS